MTNVSRPTSPVMRPVAAALLLLAACAPTSARVSSASTTLTPTPATGGEVPATGATVRLGVETFLADVPQALLGKRVGLITNSSAIDRSRRSVIDLVAAHKDLKL